MKVVTIIILVTMFSFIHCTSHNESTVETDQDIKRITTEEFADLILDNENNPDFQILDIRTPSEYEESRIENAENIDYYSNTFKQELDKLDKNSTYLVYCRSGNRSSRALSIFRELGFKIVYEMGGGITKWVSEDRPVVK